MRPNPDLPAFSMETPAKVARALLQYLALLISTLHKRHQETKKIQSVPLSRHERTPQQKFQQQLNSDFVTAIVANEVSRASYREERGRSVPVKSPLQFKLVETKEFVGEPFAVISIWKCMHQTCRVGSVLEASLLQGFVENIRLPKLSQLLLKEKSMCLNGQPGITWLITKLTPKGLVLSCLVLSCLVLSCLVLSCLLSPPLPSPPLPSPPLPSFLPSFLSFPFLFFSVLFFSFLFFHASGFC